MSKFLLLFSFLTVFSTTAIAEEKLSDAEQTEVRNLVRDTLLANPEIILEAMQILQEKQELAKQLQQEKALKTLAKTIDSGPLTPKAGNPNGDVTMIEFFDYQCGYCKRAFPGVMEVIKSDKNVKYILKEYAILGPASEIAARAALAAQKQGKYMELHTALMTVRGRLNEDKIMKMAQAANLDIDQLKKDMQSEDVSAEITSTRQIAQQLSITGTPAFIIGNQIIPGAVPPEMLKEAIAKEREMAKK